MRVFTCALVILASVVASREAAAVPVTLDFPGTGGPSPAINGEYQVAAPLSSFIPNGFNGLFVASAGAQTILSRVDGAPFNFDSITFLHNDPTVNVVFTGLLPGGGMVTHPFLDTTAGTDVAVLPSSFDSVVSVSWNQGTSPTSAYAFDFLVVSSTPEPGTLGLLALGAAGLAGRRRRAA